MGSICKTHGRGEKLIQNYNRSIWRQRPISASKQVYGGLNLDWEEEEEVSGGKRPLGTPRSREDTETELKETMCEWSIHWISLALDKTDGRPL
jgi:hypothetical protein